MCIDSFMWNMDPYDSDEATSFVKKKKIRFHILCMPVTGLPTCHQLTLTLVMRRGSIAIAKSLTTHIIFILSNRSNWTSWCIIWSPPLHILLDVSSQMKWRLQVYRLVLGRYFATIPQFKMSLSCHHWVLCWHTTCMLFVFFQANAQAIKQHCMQYDSI